MTRITQNKKPLEKKTPARRKVKNFPIACIGGSAGSFQGIEKFFTHMPADSGIAFVIIMHLDPEHKGQIAELIQNYTAMPVIEANDGVPVEPDKVYIIPPNKDMGIHNRKLLLLKPSKPHGFRQPIDYFLQSLAEDQWNRAVAIILSGMGSDGETGVRMIKEKLGMAMVQDPDTAKYASMPLASIGTNLIDYVLAPEEMPIRLIQYLNHPILSEEANEELRSEIANSNSIEKILMLLRSHTGHDFALYKKSTITRRIDRRIAFHQLHDYASYVNHLREDPHEIDVLFNELLIGVTKFFRDEAAFDSLQKLLLTRLSSKESDEQVRIWVAGCSTGEEAYSIAIIIMECLETLPKKKLPRIQIFATDLDPEAIETARAGQYHDNIAAYITPARLERFFIKKNSHYHVKKELREMIVFAQHNLIKDAPFTRLDLLCCRNVMIYLTTELQKKIIPVFHYSISPNGIMFMGPAETIGGFTDMFRALDPKWKLFERRQGELTSRITDFPFHVSKAPLKTVRTEEIAGTMQKRTAEETFNKILLENFTPASVLINEKGDILYSSGKTGRYLELPGGEAVMNIHKMAKEDLRYVLGNIIHQARSQKGVAEIADVRLKEDGQARSVNLKASLLQESSFQGLILVIFEDKGLVKKASPKIAKNGHDVKVVEELEKELVYTKQQLNSTIEQMETSLEELKSTNEELQSTNEELQSTNEESLTTKEEMQSLNEELMTINVQYQSKADELTRINNDMKNLLDATEIGTIFLDNNMEILRFTPQVRKLFNLIPSDVGRPIMHIASNFDHPEVENEIREVIDKLTTVEVEIKTKAGDWYRLRVIPYRTMDNFISGAVLTFTLISTYKKMEYRLKGLQKYAAGTVSTMNEAALLLDRDMNMIAMNQKFLKLFRIKEASVKNSSFAEFIAEHATMVDFQAWLNKCHETGKPASCSLTINDIGEKKFELTANPFSDENKKEILLTMIVIHEHQER
ncbi:MAG: CheR family methyltransferase [Bacteroidota bacterium]